MGSALFVLIWWFFLQPLPLWLQWLLLIIASLMSFPIIHNATIQLAQHDAKQIVWDEFIGMWITLLFMSLFMAITSSEMSAVTTLYSSVAAFVLFRFFDIMKPYPIGLIDEKIQNAWGVLFDDVVAGIFAGLVLVFFLYFIAS